MFLSDPLYNRIISLRIHIFVALCKTSKKKCQTCVITTQMWKAQRSKQYPVGRNTWPAHECVLHMKNAQSCSCCPSPTLVSSRERRETGEGWRSVEECPSSFLSTAFSPLLFSFLFFVLFNCMRLTLSPPFSVGLVSHTLSVRRLLYGVDIEWHKYAWFRKLETHSLSW